MESSVRQTDQKTTKNNNGVSLLTATDNKRKRNWNVPIDVSVVTVLSLVLDVASVDGDLPGLLFGCPIDVFIGHRFTPTLFAQDFRQGLRQRRLSVIDMADRSDVDVWFGPVEIRSEATCRDTLEQRRCHKRRSFFRRRRRRCRYRHP